MLVMICFRYFFSRLFSSLAFVGSNVLMARIRLVARIYLVAKIGLAVGMGRRIEAGENEHRRGQQVSERPPTQSRDLRFLAIKSDPTSIYIGVRELNADPPPLAAGVP